MKTSASIRFSLLSAIAALLPMTPSSFAQETVAQYLFPATGDFSNSATSAIAGASAMTNPAAGTITSTGLHYFRNNTANAIPESLNVALTNNTYIGFTVTPGAEPVSYDTLSFAFGLSNSTTTADPYTGTWAVFSSVSGFSSTDLLATGSFSLAKSSGASAFWQAPAPSVALDSFAGLQYTETPTEFRIYFYDNFATATSNVIMRFDTVELTASAGAAPPIPEPSTYALLMGACALGGVLLHRRRRQA